MAKSFEEQLAIAAAVWNSFKMVREHADRAEREAIKKAKEASLHEQEAYMEFLALAEKATLEPVSAHE